jgi:hypothetical protein
MAGPEKHSKKPKAVTIDLTANTDTVAGEAAENPPVQSMADTAEDFSSSQPAETTDHASSENAPDINAPNNKAPDIKETWQKGPEPVSNAPTMPASGGFLGKAGAGLAGGLIALAGAAALQFGGVLPNLGSDADIAAVRQEVAKLGATPSFNAAPLFAEIQSVKDQIATLDGRVSALPEAGGDAASLKPLEDKIAALEAALAAGAPSGGVDPVALQALSAKVAALEGAQRGPGGASAVALAIAASGLKAAIDRGGPFMAELETYATVAPASADIDALRSLAAAGVPSRQDIINGFGATANAMLAASQTPDPDAGVLQRLADSAKNLVRARPVGDIAGDTPEALVARMEIAIGRGDFDAALGEAAKLPPASLEAGKTWLDQVKARRDTDALVGKALQMALTAAGGKS